MSIPALMLLAAALAAAPERRVLDRVAATVNGEVVTLSELTDKGGAEYRRADELPPGESREKARSRVLKAAFDVVLAEKLFASQAKALELEVSEAQVDAAVEDIKRRNHFDDVQLDQALAEQGMDRAGFRRAVKRDLEAYQILNFKVRSRVKVTDEDVKNYYQTHTRDFAGDDEVKVRHIFLALPAPADEAKVRARAEKLLARVRGGEDFAAVAKEVSEGPSAADGGDLGWIRRGTVQREIEQAAFALKPGQISGLVKAGPGLHILQVEDRRTSGARPFDEVKDEIRDRLTNEQLESQRQAYVSELKREAVIDLKMAELKD
jgi:peptidyl-prolyl cis-trans isomerase SurA